MMARKVNKWVATTIAEVSAVVGVSSRTIKEYLSRGCPGRPGRYPLPEIIGWCKETVWKSRAVAADPLLAGDDSPSLERYREAKASQEEIKLENMRREFLPRDEIRLLHDELADVYRRAGEQLAKRFGQAVTETIEQCLRDATARIEQRWGSDRVGPKIADSGESD